MYSFRDPLEQLDCQDHKARLDLLGDPVRGDKQGSQESPETRYSTLSFKTLYKCYNKERRRNIKIKH